MTAIPSTSPLNWGSPITPEKGAGSPGKIGDAARQFEALLIGQMMRTMRESFAGGAGSGEDQAGASMSEFAEQQMAQVLSTNGGFGLASLIEQGLSRSAQPETLKHPVLAKRVAPG